MEKNVLKRKEYDLEVRTKTFAKNVRLFLKTIKPSVSSFEDGKQLVRSSGSVGANYIEANESLSKKDFVYRISICRKEAKESMFWLDMFSALPQDIETKRTELAQEALELLKIFNAIIEKSKQAPVI